MKINLNKLPTLIIETGLYKTRSGNTISINQIVSESDNNHIEFNCRHVTKDHVGKIVNIKTWHKSGRISQYSESPLDIIEKIQ